nr:hypothetical protein [uncultured Gellertiella sp.]
MKTSARRLVAGCLAVFCIGSLAGLLEESRPFLLPSPQGADFFREFDTSSRFFGSSSYSKYLVMMDCRNGLRRIAAEGFQDATKKTFIETCHAIASAIVAREPSFSLGWYIRARSEIALLDVKDFNASLVMAQMTAPREQWQAEDRAELGEDNSGWLNEEATRSHYQDLETLARSYAGSSFLATRYQSDPVFRDKIVSIVEKMPAIDQRRFLANVRKLARNG